MKQYVPNWIKSPIRRWLDNTRREGHFFEHQGRHDVIHQSLITLDFNGIPGVYAEFGCCGANTFGFAHQALKRCRTIKRQMWAFDSFAGLPPADCPEDDHPRWLAGTMKMGLDEFQAACRKKGIKDYQVLQGFYSETLTKQPDSFLPAGEIAMAYIDCDLYSSSLDVLRFLKSRLQHGMIVAFDDYWCYSKTDISGERKAFLEVFVGQSGWHFEPYLSYGWAGMSFVVEKC